jgi:hypothetical protein
MGIGQYQQDQQQQLINAAMDRWNFNQNQPLANLQAYNQILQGGATLGSTSSNNGTQSQGRNPFTGALGGAAMGASLGSVFPVIGTGIGAIGGALLGGLFG